MLFISPMWDSENQRLGMKACTPLGYAVRGIGDLIGFLGLILLLVIPGYLAVQFLRHQFLSRDLWLLSVPFVVGVVGRMLLGIGWRLALKRRFQYDSDTRTARWIEEGHERVFPHAP